MKVWWLVAAACVLGLAALSTGAWAQAEQAAKAAEAKPAYVGVAKCKMCHSSDAKGNQYKVWTHTAHAAAYDTLASAKAKAVAEKAGVTGNPQESPKCLACHVTGYDAPKEMKQASLTITEGVSCESCHGPGSEYKEFRVMKDVEAAKAKGLNPTPTEATCTKCHNKNSPTFVSFDYATMVKKIAHPNPQKAKPAGK
jgi:hypothetical protein